MTDEEKRARAWIRKKFNQGVTRGELYECVGRFSNRNKKIVMAEKRLNEKEYKKRYKFLSVVYGILLNDEKI